MNNYEYSKTLNEDERYAFFVNSRAKMNLLQFADWLMAKHVEPIRLTPEERKAAELAVAMGLPWISVHNTIAFIGHRKGFDNVNVNVNAIPALRCLTTNAGYSRPMWITETPIDLREVLRNGI